MAHVHARRRWYLVPYVAYWSLSEYIAASRAALAADVHAYQMDVALVSEATNSKERRREKAPKATAPTRDQPARASKRPRALVS